MSNLASLILASAQQTCSQRSLARSLQSNITEEAASGHGRRPVELGSVS